MHGLYAWRYITPRHDVIIEWHEISSNVVCATSKASEQPCAYAQSNQSLCQSLEYSRNIKLLTEPRLECLCLTGGYTCSSESTPVKTPYCWKSRVAVNYDKSNDDHDVIFTFQLRVFKWTFAFEMWFIPSWTNRFKPHPHTRHLSGLTSSPSNYVACLLAFAWRWTRIAMTLSAEIWRFGYSKPYVMSDLIQISGKSAK